MMFSEKGNLIIRSAIIEDAERVTQWWNDGEVMAHAGFPNGLGQSVEETMSQIKRNEVKLSQLCIIEVEHTPVGELSFGIGPDFAEIGIKICDATYQNKGYGNQVLKMLVEYLFTDETISKCVKIEKIQLDTNINNKRAQHVYEALGFKKVAINKDAFTNQLGELQTSVDYEMTREDYERGCMEV